MRTGINDFIDISFAEKGDIYILFRKTDYTDKICVICFFLGGIQNIE
jgi:hypothetical protein